MKKPLSYAVTILAGISAGILISGAIFAATGMTIFGKLRENPTSTAPVNSPELIALAYDILGYIRDGDNQALAGVVHPEYGVVFSPYATVTLSTNKCFQPEQVAGFGEDTNLYVWGVYAGSGEPIEMTVADYFSIFVMDKDYSAAPVVGINHIVRSGNALENFTDEFKNVQFIDFHMPGNEANGGEGNDWSSLRLGFEEYDGSLWLTVILRSQWMA